MSDTRPWPGPAFPLPLAAEAQTIRSQEAVRRRQDKATAQNFDTSGYAKGDSWRCTGPGMQAHHWVAEGRTWRCQGCTEVRPMTQEDGAFYEIGRSVARRRNRQKVGAA